MQKVFHLSHMAAQSATWSIFIKRTQKMSSRFLMHHTSLVAAKELLTASYSETTRVTFTSIFNEIDFFLCDHFHYGTSPPISWQCSCIQSRQYTTFDSQCTLCKWNSMQLCEEDEGFVCQCVCRCTLVSNMKGNTKFVSKPRLLVMFEC